MTDQSILINLALILVAATAGGILAVRLKQPVILGYLIAGVIIGPFTPGPEADFDQLRLLTEVGIALLLFVLGARMTVSQFQGVGKVIVIGGAFQVALTIGLGLAFMPLFGLGVPEALLLGTILAQSSSAVIAKILEDRNEPNSIHGRIAIGVIVVQDISSFPILLILLVFLGEGNHSAGSFVLAIGQVFGLAVLTYIFGRLLWPRILEMVGRLNSNELTLLTMLALALGGSLVVQAIGLSFALGAYLAGLVVAESPLRPAALSRVLPFRDVFAAVFFVSIGTLFNPAILWQQPLSLLGLLAALLIGKTAITVFSLKLFRVETAVAVMSGLLLAQIGEFAFILANIGLDRGAIPDTLFSVLIGAAVISIFANSLLLDSAPPVMDFFARVTGFALLKKEPVTAVASLLRRRKWSNRFKKTPGRPHK